MKENVEIDGLKYEISRNYANDLHETIANLKGMEAIRWYIVYLYRTPEGVCRACYADDTNNNWSI